MPKQKSILIIVIIFCAFFFAAKKTQAAELSIPDSRRIDWTTSAGIPGGIPEMTTNCATTACTDLLAATSETDISTLLTAAITSATAGDVVRIPAGDFNVSERISLSKNNIVLRGAGMNSTNLTFSSGADIYMVGGGNPTWGPYPAGGTILSGYEKGSTSVVLSGPTTNLKIGDELTFSQDNDTSFIWSRWGKEQLYIHGTVVTAISQSPVANMVSFLPAIPYGFTAGLNPIYTIGRRFANNASVAGSGSGIEDFTIDATDAAADSPVKIYGFDKFWVKGVKIYNIGNVGIWIGEGATRGEIRECVIDETSTGNEGYGISLSHYNSYIGAPTGILIENNIFSNLYLGIIHNAGNGNVFGYNYFYKMAANTINRFAGGIGVHGPHPMMSLYEGNTAATIALNDGYHGSVSHTTLFRNRLHAMDEGGTATSDYWKSAVTIGRYGRYMNIFGNVLGNSSWTPTSYQDNTCSPAATGSNIYSLGYPNGGANGNYVVCNDVCGVGNASCVAGSNVANNPPGGVIVDGQSTSGNLDLAVQATLVRHLNYDFKTHSVRNCTDETEGCQGVTGTTLPASLYKTEKPSWWCDETPWPAIGPDVEGYFNKTPAQRRFEGLSCTVNGGETNDTTPPSAPNGLQVS